MDPMSYVLALEDEAVEMDLERTNRASCVIAFFGYYWSL